MELDEDIHRRVATLCAAGDALAESGRHAEAIEEYRSAWEVLPEPRSEWEAATWILVAIGDAEFLRGDFAACRRSMIAALACPGGIENPFVYLRLGESAYELGDRDGAADALMRAYMAGDAEVFEHENSKYFDFLKTRALPPVSGW